MKKVKDYIIVTSVIIVFIFAFIFRKDVTRI
ncbi:unknown [Butyrivibrio sp. CAG:318]|nr:unknown [Butyrivibrio sp. CAG:318]